MSGDSLLSRSRPCQHCGQTIRNGTRLSELAWDPNAREWSHARPSCPEHREEPAVPAEPPGSASGPAADGKPAATVPPSRDAISETDGRDSARAPWSVTVEVHSGTGSEPARRVVRIARLYLGTYEEARAIADALREFV